MPGAEPRPLRAGLGRQCTAMDHASVGTDDDLAPPLFAPRDVGEPT